MAQESSSLTDYTGPSVQEMIKNHSLVENIMNHHNNPCPIFDGGELVLLRRFVDDPSSREQILRDCNMDDPENAKYMGEGAQAKGSLAGFIVARHGMGWSDGDSDRAGDAAITAAEIGELKKWFDSGAADERMKGALATGTNA